LVAGRALAGTRVEVVVIRVGIAVAGSTTFCDVQASDFGTMDLNPWAGVAC
jgi:hypothetical protein